MKRAITCASIADQEFLKHSRKIYSRAKELLDAIEDAPEDVLDECDANDLYEVLIEDIPAIALAIKTHNQKKSVADDYMW